MNLPKGHVNVLFRLTQAPKRNILFVPPLDRVRGMRFGLARRLLGAATGEDILPPELARRLAKKPNAVYRWETGEDRPRQDTVAELADMCQRAGLPITAGWLERGETGLLPIEIPALALEPKAAAVVDRKFPVESAEEETPAKTTQRRKRKRA